MDLIKKYNLTFTGGDATAGHLMHSLLTQKGHRMITSLFLSGATFVLAWTSILTRIEGLIFVFFYAGALIHQAFIATENRGRHYLKLLIWLGIPRGASLIALGILGIQGLCVNQFDQVYDWLHPLVNGEFLNSYFQIYHRP